MAGDKKLTLESVPGHSAAAALKVLDVLDEYTLRLDLDALSDPERKTLFDDVVRATDEVDVEHGRLVLDETVAKLA